MLKVQVQLLLDHIHMLKDPQLMPLVLAPMLKDTKHSLVETIHTRKVKAPKQLENIHMLVVLTQSHLDPHNTL